MHSMDTQINLPKKITKAEACFDQFLAKTASQRPVSFFEIIQVFETAVWTQQVLDDHENDKGLNDRFSHRLGDSALWFLLHLDDMMSVTDVSADIAAKVKEIGDVIAKKNEERYNYNASLRPFSPVIAARRAEVEAMLDAADSRKLELAAARI